MHRSANPRQSCIGISTDLVIVAQRQQVGAVDQVVIGAAYVAGIVSYLRHNALQ